MASLSNTRIQNQQQDCTPPPKKKRNKSCQLEISTVFHNFLFQAIEEGVSHMWTVSAFQQHGNTMIICDEDATLELRVRTVKYFKVLLGNSMGVQKSDIVLNLKCLTGPLKTNFLFMDRFEYFFFFDFVI